MTTVTRPRRGAPKEIKLIGDKPVYRQSEIVNFFECPKRFHLSRQFQQKATPAMDEGLLIEGLIFGFKDEAEKERIVGRKRDSTLASYDQIVKAIKPYFVEGQSFVKMRYEGPEWVLEGEADFIGTIQTIKGPIRAIGDLKFTKNIARIWDGKSSKREYLQSVFYPFIWWKTTGELLPFVYNVVENEKDLPADVPPLVRQIFFMPTVREFEWVETLINTVNDALFYEPNVNACYGGQFGNVRCPYLYFCTEGRKLIESSYEIDFNLLED